MKIKNVYVKFMNDCELGTIVPITKTWTAVYTDMAVFCNAINWNKKDAMKTARERGGEPFESLLSYAYTFHHYMVKGIESSSIIGVFTKEDETNPYEENKAHPEKLNCAEQNALASLRHIFDMFGKRVDKGGREKYLYNCNPESLRVFYTLMGTNKALKIVEFETFCRRLFPAVLLLSAGNKPTVVKEKIAETSALARAEENAKTDEDFNSISTDEKVETEEKANAVEKLCVAICKKLYDDVYSGKLTADNFEAELKSRLANVAIMGGFAKPVGGITKMKK